MKTARKTTKRKVPGKGAAGSGGALRRAVARKGTSEIGPDAVKEATGKTWPEWLRTLDAEGAAKMPHRDIAALVHEKHGLGKWWAQMVTVGYERARGLREKHQRPDGYSVSVSRTMGASAAAAFEAWTNARKRAKWLVEEVEIRKATPNKTVRITWKDTSSVEVRITPKGAAKAQVVVEHSKLKSATAAERTKKYWAERLGELAAVLGA